MSHKLKLAGLPTIEVLAEFRDGLADLFDTYASDQLAMANRNLGKRDATIRADVYSRLAEEIRAIEIIE